MSYQETEVENAVFIGIGIFEKLQELYNRAGLPYGQHEIVVNDIIPWAVEAEKEYQETVAGNPDANEYCDYYDFIDRFAERKLNELKESLGID
jgi:hypothetical protein